MDDSFLLPHTNVKNRYVFHGSRNRSREAKGLHIFAEPQAQVLRTVIGRMLLLAGKMIPWYMRQVGQPELISAFTAELVGSMDHTP